MKNKFFPFLKKIVLFILISCYFSFFVTLTLLMVNPQLRISYWGEFFDIFAVILLYYGMILLLILLFFYMLYRIFTERGSASFVRTVFGWAALINVIALTLLVFNFRFYRQFLDDFAVEKFYQAGFLNLIVFFLYFLFLLFKKIYRQVTLILSLLVIIAQIYFGLVLTSAPLSPKRVEAERKGVTYPLAERKLKIVVFEGLSLDTVLNFIFEEKLLNFKYLKQNGSYGYIANHRPAFLTSLLTTLLSGQMPDEHRKFSDIFFKLRGADVEFQNWPRFVFFRNMELLKLISFYRKIHYRVNDRFQQHFFLQGRKSFLIYPWLERPNFSEKNLARNKNFQRFFVDWKEDQSQKTMRLKRTFFFDDYLRRLFSNYRDDNTFYYLVFFPGLQIINSHFFHFAHPEIFSAEELTGSETYRLVLERYYQYYDSVLGGVLAGLKNNEILCVLNLSEPEILPPWRRFFARFFGGRDVYMYSSARSRGVFFVLEKNAIRQNNYLENFPIHNFFTTISYYLGFPLSRELKGEVQQELFLEKFIKENPIYFQ